MMPTVKEGTVSSNEEKKESQKSPRRNVYSNVAPKYTKKNVSDITELPLEEDEKVSKQKEVISEKSEKESIKEIPKIATRKSI